MPLEAAAISPTPARSLAPREHGAYGQLGVPLFTALALGRPGVAGFCLAAAAVLVFVAHESLLVLLGQRGKKARTQDGARAARWLAILGGAGAILGGLGLFLAPSAARLAALPPLGLAALVFVFVFRKEEKTALGEIFAAAALSGAGFPVAVAGGVALERAGLAWAVWTIAFLVATLAVRAVIARAKRQGRLELWFAYGSTLLFGGASAGLSAAGYLPWAAVVALAPFFLLSLGVCLFPVHTRQLRRVGWGLIGASVATSALLIATLR